LSFLHHFGKKYGFEEGSQLIVEALPDGVFLRPVVTLPVEIYTPERKAEFVLKQRYYTRRACLGS